MPWLAIPFEGPHDTRDALKSMFQVCPNGETRSIMVLSLRCGDQLLIGQVQGIPALIIISQQTVVTVNGVEAVMEDPKGEVGCPALKHCPLPNVKWVVKFGSNFP